MTAIKLKYPVEFDGQQVSELTLRRPTVRDMIEVDKRGGSDFDKEFHAFANLCGITPKQIELLDLADYQAVQAAYQDFLS